MEELSFFDKLKVLYDNILDHPLFTLLFLVPIIIFFMHKRHGKKVFVIVYFLVIFILLVSFGDIIFKLFDNLMDGLFMVLYFPNFITLFFVVILCSLIALVSLFSKKIHKVNKIINYVSFGIIQSLFALILLTVRVNKINIYKDNALYTNSDVLTLMQLLIGTFAMQALSILIINAINKATSILDDKSNNFSSDINNQIKTLSNSKIKPINIDNNKIGFINVADKAITSKPKLKPFIFDLNKLQSIKIDDSLYNTKPYKSFIINDKDVTYSNEIISKKVLSPIKLDYDKIINLEIPNKLYNKVLLEDKDVTYLNEIIKVRKFKPVIIDSNKLVNLKVPDRILKKVFLQDKNVTYLNEIIKVRKFKTIRLDSNKLVYLTIPNKIFSVFVLENKDATYSNEVTYKPEISAFNIDQSKNITVEVPDKKYTMSSIDSSKPVNIDVPIKPYNKVSLKDKAVSYINEIIKNKKMKPIKLDLEKTQNIKLDINDSNEFKYDEKIFKEKNKPFDYKKEVIDNKKKESLSKYNKIFNSKPDLLATHDYDLNINEDKKINRVTEPIISFPISKEKNLQKKLVDNLVIIDIQSMLDVASKSSFMKYVNLKTFDNKKIKLTIEKLKVCNFKLLTKVLSKYTLVKKD